MKIPKLRLLVMTVALSTATLAPLPGLAAQLASDGDSIQLAQQGGKSKDKKSKSKKHKSKKKHKTQTVEAILEAYVGDQDRYVIHDYYADQFERGHCPPGLAKKNNGCLPPGQAKKWHIGEQLPDDVEYHELPDQLLRELSRLPEGYKLIRVGVDILKIAVGTRLVLEAIEDLGQVL